MQSVTQPEDSRGERVERGAVRVIALVFVSVDCPDCAPHRGPAPTNKWRCCVQLHCTAELLDSFIFSLAASSSDPVRSQVYSVVSRCIGVILWHNAQ